MSSVVDICNLSISHIGQRAVIASISPADATIEAQACARFYPLARDEMLSHHLWGFAMTREDLQIVADAAPPGWLYAYQVPNNCLRIASVIDPLVTSDGLENYYLTDTGVYRLSEQVRLPTPAYIREGDLLFSNVANAVVRFVSRITDTTKYPPFLVTSISHRLAAFLAGYIIKGKEGRAVSEGQMKLAYAMQGEAEKQDGNSERTNTYRNALPTSLAVRR